VSVFAWWLDIQLPMQSVSIATDVVDSTLAQENMHKFVSDLRQVVGFLISKIPIKGTYDITNIERGSDEINI
jgi:hypothetical protein